MISIRYWIRYLSLTSWSHLYGIYSSEKIIRFSKIFKYTLFVKNKNKKNKKSGGLYAQSKIESKCPTRHSTASSPRSHPYAESLQPLTSPPPLADLVISVFNFQSFQLCFCFHFPTVTHQTKKTCTSKSFLSLFIFIFFFFF